MNARQLEKLGVPRHCARFAIAAVQTLVAERKLSRTQIKGRISQVTMDPPLFVGDPVFDALAKSLLEEVIATPRDPVAYRT